MNKQRINLGEIRKVAVQFNLQTIRECQLQAMNNQDNVCYSAAGTEAVMNVLAKAEFVRNKMEKGIQSNDAIRELGKRIRSFQAS